MAECATTGAYSILTLGYFLWLLAHKPAEDFDGAVGALGVIAVVGALQYFTVVALFQLVRHYNCTIVTSALGRKWTFRLYLQWIILGRLAQRPQWAERGCSPQLRALD